MANDPTRPPPAGHRRPVLAVRLARYAARELAPQRAWAHRTAQRARSGSAAGPGADPGREIDHQWHWSACYAPYTSMYLDQFGQVRACCQNTGHLLGDIRRSTLREIWDGTATRTLRAALAQGDFGSGCEFCAWQVEEGDGTDVFLRTYDDGPAGWSTRPRWPHKLEFAVTNTCNLQCVMCNGDWSSTIRAKREGRPPLEPAYPERFYDELVEFVPHLRLATFTGGEPFLGREPLRIMDLLVEHGRADLVLAVVTNGTIWTDRVERVLAATRPWVSVSVDGGTKEVYERVRVGASFETVMGNLDRFAAIVADHGVGLTLTHCLMVDNWETFPELLALAEERRLPVSINTVRFPEAHSLYHLPPDRLDEVIDGLDRRSAEVERRITGERLAVWHHQLAALRGRASASAWPEALGVPPRP